MSRKGFETGEEMTVYNRGWLFRPNPASSPRPSKLPFRRNLQIHTLSYANSRRYYQPKTVLRSFTSERGFISNILPPLKERVESHIPEYIRTSQ
ncbi:hypothetical protein TNCV_1545121 [Trichonephila clavipes]|nr:hypothetical protein TNCV_1545121 [Trichonephila clavipes]